MIDEIIKVRKLIANETIIKKNVSENFFLNNRKKKILERKINKPDLYGSSNNSAMINEIVVKMAI
ncbi:MAG: hypothetical protein FWD48_02945 [Oscillospiraceae bacterium]|nr:hypothetical protein [Oscillospiraceae bacterium]